MSKLPPVIRPLLLLALAGVFLVQLYSRSGIFRWLDSRLTPDISRLVATVAGEEITRSQLDRAVAERLWLAGKSTAKAAPAELEAARTSALEELIDETLLNRQASALANQLAADDAEITARIGRFSDRFETKAAMEAALKSQGLADEAALRARIAAQIRRENYVELRITPAIRTSDEEARQWFEANQASVSLPERIEARHVFIATLNQPPDEAKQKLATALADLTAGKKDFPTLAKELSEDPATKDNGGALGWMERGRLPADFAAPVFAMTQNQPALVRTKLGWHLVEVTARKPAEPRTFDQAKPEILAAIEAVKRQDAVAAVRQSLRAAGKSSIRLF